MLKRILCIILLWLTVLPCRLSAQSAVKITGLVTDAETGRPLPSVHVTVAGSGDGAVTDGFGRYRLEDLPAGHYQLHLSHVSYQPQTSPLLPVTADIVTHWDCALLPAVRQGDPVIITAPRWQALLDNPAAEVTTITAADIARTGAVTVSDVLRQTPGLHLQEYSGAGGPAAVSIRGSDTDEVLVLMDGVRLNAPHSSTVDISGIPVTMIDRIDVIRGGDGATYGSNAVGGVVHIHTRTGRRDDEARTSARLTAGSFGRFDAGFHHDLHIRNFSLRTYYDRLHATGDFSYTDPFTGSPVHRHNNDLTSHQLFSKASWSDRTTSVDLSSRITGSDRGLPGFVPNETRASRSQDRLWLLNGEVSHSLTPQWRLTARTNYQRVRDDDAHTPEPDYPTAIPPYRTRTSTQSLESGVSADWQGPFNQKVHGGASYRRDRMEGRDLLRPAFSIGAVVRPIHAAFLDYTWESGLMPFADRLALHGAARYEYSGDTIAQFSPRAGFSISRGNGTSARLRADAGRSYRLPDFYDLYFEGYRSRGNPALLPERGWDVDTGIELTHEGAGYWKGTGTWFRNRRKDVIQWRQAFDGTFTPMNVPRADIDGGEFSLSWSTDSRWLTIGGDYLLTRAINRTGERTTDGKWLTNRPRHITNGYVQVQWRSLHVDIRGRIVGKRFVTEANTVALPGYQVLNLTIRERVPLMKSWHTTVGLTCQNLLNERYEILEGAPLPGRDMRLLVQLEF